MNYNIIELTLSYIINWEKLIKLSNVNKLWMEIIKTSKSVWKNVEVNLYHNKHIINSNFVEFKQAKYPIQHLYCNDNITDECLKYLPLKSLGLTLNDNITDEGIKKLQLHSLHCNKNITDEGIKNMPLNILKCHWNRNITNKGIKNLHVDRSGSGASATRPLQLEELSLALNENITNEGRTR
jgi:hypothetical protein